jgi:Spy/CpxP family protein refolding chaperone
MYATNLTPSYRPAGLRLAAATLLVALSAGAWQAASAAPGMHGRGPDGDGPGMGLMAHPRGLDRMLDKVNATAEQRSQIRAIAEAAKADTAPLREQARTLRQQAQALFTQPTVDARAAETLRQQMSAVHDQLSKRHLQTMIDISRVLSPEQRAKIAEAMNQRRGMMERRMPPGERPAAR